jgi:2'-hydroxyisoflavone reductase
VNEALARGWEVTTFNRGRSGADTPGVTAVRGDRESPEDLARLAGHGPWDAVADICGYAPSVVGRSVAALADQADSYLFVSTINVYPDFPATTVNEDSRKHECAADAGPEDGDYGTLKAGCERAVREGFPGRTLVLQPGLIYGPGDPMPRLPWWLLRSARGGRMLAGGAPERPMQLIDARDIAAFGLDLVAAGAGGEYLVTAPGPNTTWGEYLGACVEATGGKAEPVWVDDDAFLLVQDVDPWSELPLWAPQGGEFTAVWSVDAGRAREAGLRCRPALETVRDTARWLFEEGGEEVFTGKVPRHPGRWGLAPEKEQQLLAEWDAR